MRLGRYALAAFTYLCTLPPLAACYAFGYIAAVPAVAIACAVLGANALLYALFRTGANLRFADPSLTLPQLYLAITLLMFSVYHVEVRALALSLCYVIFLFGVFRLTTREFVTLTLYTLAAYALVVNLLMHLRPESIADVHREWLSWLLLASTLPWMGIIGGTISGMRARLRERNRELAKAVDTIHTMATRDEVTGLHNRAFFTETLRHVLAQTERHQRRLALLFIDADRFKNINDSLGHLVGDEVLREIGRRIGACVRSSDVVARLGGDEFVVLVEDIRSPESAHEIAQKIVAAAARPLGLQGRELVLSLSVGVAVAPEDGREAEQLMRSADIAMYQAKAAGRNGYRFYSRSMGAAAEERLILESELARAIEGGELLLYYQPKLRVACGGVAGAEALLRWRHPRHGLIGPQRFIEVAEETGTIVPIGRWVLDRACRQAAAWPGGAAAASVAVNLSPRQFSDPGLPRDVDLALAHSGLPPQRLELEVTESMVMNDPERAAAMMQALRERGVKLSMDDFGTGYSSLASLKRFPLDRVKIDRSFIKGLPQDDDDAAITRAVLAMARALHLQVVAEGVERAEQLAFLRGEACEEFQGYYCSPPLPEDRFAALLQDAALAAA